MILGRRGAELIKSYEKLSLVAYKPTPNDVWTIGWGHTKDVQEGMICSKEAAEIWFVEDTQDAVNAVNSLKVPLTQSMFDALVSLTFNTGSAVSRGNTIQRCLSLKDYYGTWRAIGLWTKQAGKDLLGLARRRSAEMSLFLEDGLPK